MDCGIVWYKCNDLRVRDHEPLLQAHTECKNVLHVFVFDPFWFGTARESHLPKCGPYKGKFLLESIADLRKVRWTRCVIVFGHGVHANIRVDDDVPPPKFTCTSDVRSDYCACRAYVVEVQN